MTETNPDAADVAARPRSTWAGEKILLRAYEPEDWESERIFDDPTDQRSGWKIWPPRSTVAHRKWSANAAAEEPGGDALEFRLAIARRTDRVLVGTINVHSVNQTNGTFMYGVSVGAEHKGNGYAGEAILLIMRYMFDERRFQKCEAGVFDYNSASLALHQKLGFVEEGRLRRHAFSGGQYHDDVRFGMTAEEFHQWYPELKSVL